MRKRTTTVVLAAGMALLALADAASAYYSPQMGRFLSRDPVGEPGARVIRQVAATTQFLPRDPIDKNGYVAMQNNPISWFDPDGGQATTMPATNPATQPAAKDVIELWCYNIARGRMHCDIKCVDGITGTTTIGGGTGPVSSGGNGGVGGDPSWRIKTGVKGTLAGSTTAPTGTCKCISAKGNKINTIKDKIYDFPPELDGNISNSNALGSTLLTCCGVSITPSVNAPGWGHQVETETTTWVSVGQPGFGPSFSYAQTCRGRISCKDLN
jgi:hypothetical protein